MYQELQDLEALLAETKESILQQQWDQSNSFGHA